MPKTNIKNLIIFGDSMSDIGNKRETGTGRFARLLGLMRTNAIGRYSDGKNWTDFLWEWAGARTMVQTNATTTNANSEVHRSLTRDSSQDSGFGRPITYVNYAEGGAMGASDRPATGLGTFKDQVLRYMRERERFPLEGDTMHILWFGLNDLVTNGRDPGTMGRVVDELGAGMRTIEDNFRTGREHFMVVALPSPAGAMRFLKKNDLKLVVSLDKGAQVFNQHLSGLSNGVYYTPHDNLLLVDMFTWLNTVNDNLPAFNLLAESQPHGVPVDYGLPIDRSTLTPPLNNPGALEAARRCVTTSDDAHPTEAVYRLIARPIAKTLISRYDLGTLGSNVNATADLRVPALPGGPVPRLPPPPGELFELDESSPFEFEHDGAESGRWERRGDTIILHGM